MSSAHGDTSVYTSVTAQPEWLYGITLLVVAVWVITMYGMYIMHDIHDKGFVLFLAANVVIETIYALIVCSGAGVFRKVCAVFFGLWIAFKMIVLICVGTSCFCDDKKLHSIVGWMYASVGVLVTIAVLRIAFASVGYIVLKRSKYAI